MTNYDIGELHPKYGLYCGSRGKYEFNIQSLKGNKKYMSWQVTHKRNGGWRHMTMKTPNGNKEQVFYFNCKTETIEA
jgi:hypothetical protein